VSVWEWEWPGCWPCARRPLSGRLQITSCRQNPHSLNPRRRKNQRLPGAASRFLAFLAFLLLVAFCAFDALRLAVAFV
jgi:hypothetical protein